MDAVTYRSRCLNPCDYYFWKTRGYACRPDDWEDILEREGYYDSESESESDEESEETDDEESDYYESESDEYDEEEWQNQRANDIKSRENNPCDHLYWQKRGYASRPQNWRDLTRRNRQINNNNQQVVPNQIRTAAGRGAVVPRNANTAVAGSSTGAAAAVTPDSNLCKICWERPLECVLLNCSHFCTCVRCSSRLKSCPICRKSIARVLRVYKS